MDQHAEYLRLVRKRKACRLCADLRNPNCCEGGQYDEGEHLGPWSRWQGNLDSELMIVGQDWGGEDHYIRHRGIGNDENATNKRLCELLRSIGFRIQLPQQTNGDGALFFTNAILCLRSSGLSGPTRQEWFKNCSREFLRPLIELVKPKAVATLGYKAYRSVLDSFQLSQKSRMRDAVMVESVLLPTIGSRLVPMYHPGPLGTVSRLFEQQRSDWQRVRRALDL